MKQFTLTTIPLLCAAVAPLCADAQGTVSLNTKSQAAAPMYADAQGNGNNNKSKQQQQEQDEQDRQYKQRMMNMITPVADPYVQEGVDFLLTADFIWWKAQEDGLNYAFGSTMNQPSFKYKPGFKVGAGLKFARDGWDIYAQYTWLRSKNKMSGDGDGDADDSSSGGATSSNMFTPLAGGLFTNPLTSASASWQMQLNALDLELGRNFWVSKWLTLRPFVGFKLAFNNQTLGVDYAPSALSFIAPGGSISMAMKADQKWAVGLRAGLNSAWYLCKSFSIYADLAISELWNDIRSSRTDTATTAAGVTTTLADVSYKSHSITPVLEMGLGLRWETMFHCDQWMFFAQAGWEEQVWFDQNQFIMYPNFTPADLSFEGLTVKLGFYF